MLQKDQFQILDSGGRRDGAHGASSHTRLNFAKTPKIFPKIRRICSEKETPVTVAELA